MDHPKTCLGCGKDHGPGRGCGYRRTVEWTPYGAAERFRLMRIFPVVAGLAAATTAVYLLLHPPELEILFYAGVAITSLMTLIVGGFGTAALIGELRKHRWRAASTDGRDRALVVVVGGEVRYGFGETLQYAEAPDLSWAAPLSSAAALRLGAALRAPLDAAFLDWLRAEAERPDLFATEEDPEETLGLVTAAAIFGLAARQEATLAVGRFRGWGRGEATMKNVTEGTELALDANAPAADDGTPRIEHGYLRLSQPLPESPVPIDVIRQALREEGLDPGAMEALRAEAEEGEVDVEAAETAWRRLVQEETELVIQMIRHVLPDPA